MKSLKTILLLPIVLIAIVWFSIEYISPFIFLKTNSQLYSNLTIECHQTQLSLQNTESKSNQLNQNTYRKLVKSAQVGLEYCRRQEQLKNKLLSNNVKISDLRQIELETLGKEFLPFELFFKTLGNQSEKTE